MKTLVLILVSISALAQMPLDSSTHKFTYTGVVEVPGATKEEIYLRAHSWFVSYYKNADAVIQLQDKEAGRIIGKGRFGVVWQMGIERLVRHTVQIDIKEGRFRYSISNFMVYFSSFYDEFPIEDVPKGLSSGVKNLYQRTHEKSLELEASLRGFMLANSKQEDW